eukprot:TRINITY_DN11044_c0_g1_i1.p1 TRINITY_DN11044_c0_g1~~TRINITY_DN11044_c0_g1_i1.p1  ORF type:complete len:1066 (-),score=181.28 TRINITY_DN11044_c0_g1_i1:13-3210(-)
MSAQNKTTQKRKLEDEGSSPPSKKQKFVDAGDSHYSLIEKGTSVVALLGEGANDISSQFDVGYLETSILPNLDSAFEEAKKTNHKTLDRQELDLTNIHQQVKEMKSKKIHMALVGIPGVGKSKLLNILATQHMVAQSKISKEDVGKFPLPSAQSQTHITKCFFSLRHADEYKVVPKFCPETEFQRRIAMQKAVMTYPTETENILPKVTTLSEIRAQMDTVFDLLSKEHIVALDEIKIYGPWGFPVNYVIYDTPGWKMHDEDQTEQLLLHIDSLRKKTLDKMDIIGIVTLRLPNEDDLQRIIQILVQQEQDKRHYTPFIVSMYYSDVRPSKSSANIFTKSLMGTADMPLWPLNFHLPDRIRKLTEIKRNSFLFPYPACVGTAQDLFVLLQRKVLGHQIGQFSRAVNIFWHTLKTMDQSSVRTGKKSVKIEKIWKENTGIVEKHLQELQHDSNEEAVNSHYEFEFNLEELISGLYRQAINGDHKTLFDRIVDIIEFHLNTIIQDTEEMFEERLKEFVTEFIKESKAKAKAKAKKQEDDEQDEENASRSILGYFTNVMRELDRKFVELDDADKARIEQEIKKSANEAAVMSNNDSLIDFSFNEDTEEELSTPVLRNEAKFRLPLQNISRSIYRRRVTNLIDQLRIVIKQTEEFSTELLTPQKNKSSEIKELAMKESAEFKRLLRLWHSMSNPKRSRKQTASGFVQHRPLDFEKKVLPEMLEKVDSITFVTTPQPKIKYTRQTIPGNNKLIKLAVTSEGITVQIPAGVSQSIEDYRDILRKVGETDNLAPIFSYCWHNVDETPSLENIAKELSFQSQNIKCMIVLMVPDVHVALYEPLVKDKTDVFIMEYPHNLHVRNVYDVAKFVVEEFKFPMWWRISLNVINGVVQFHPQILSALPDVSLIHCLQYLEGFMRSAVQYHHKFLVDLIKKKEKAIMRKIYDDDFENKFDTLKKIRDTDPNTSVSMATLQEAIDFVKGVEDILFDLDQNGRPTSEEGRAAFNKKRVCESIQCVSVPEDRNLMNLLNYSYPKLHNLYVGTVRKIISYRSLLTTRRLSVHLPLSMDELRNQR